MPLNLDLSLLETGERFQHLCFRLAQKDYPKAIAVSGAHDEGQDAICFVNGKQDIVWQCKYTTRGISSLKARIVKSLDSLDRSQRIAKWILCVPVNATGTFVQWLKNTLRRYRFIKSWEIWSREVLLRKLEGCPDVLQTFFYGTWKELDAAFQAEELELIRVTLDRACWWEQRDRQVLVFHPKRARHSDLVFDIIVRNRSSLQIMLHRLRATVYDVRRHLRGFPGRDLLFPKITYSIALDAGKPGRKSVDLEPPLLVRPRSHQRFKIRCTRTGSSWSGYLQLSLLYGKNNELHLPTVFLVT